MTARHDSGHKSNRLSKTDLESLGESADGLANGFSKYAEEIEKITGFSILVEGTTDTYKDLYDIFTGIAEGWNDLTDTQQARVSEILGGTRQLQVVSSIMQNISDATGAYDDALNANGVALKANETYLDTIEGKLRKVSATFQELSTKVLNSELVKGIVGALGGVVTLLDKMAQLGDGFLVTIPAIMAGLAAIAGLVKTIGNSAKIATFIAGAKNILAIFPAITTFITDTIALIEFGLVPAVTTAGEAMLKSLSGGAKALLAAAVIYGVVKIVDALTTSAKELENRIDEANATISEAESKIESLSEKLKENNRLLSEANALGGSDTYKKRLQAENAELERQLAFEEAITKQAREQASNDAFKLLTEMESYTAYGSSHGGGFWDQIKSLLSDFFRNYSLSPEGEMPITLTDGTINGSVYGTQLQVAETLLRDAEKTGSVWVGLGDLISNIATLKEQLLPSDPRYAETIKQIDDLLDRYTALMNPPEGESTNAGNKYITESLKSLSDLLEDAGDGFDAITSAMTDMTKAGKLTASSITAIIKAISEGKVAGLQFEDLITRTADGFELSADAMNKYMSALLDTYITEGEFATTGDAENRIANLENLRAVIATLIATQELEEQKKALEEQKEQINELGDSYKNLIDIRKDLLSSYKSELDYQKELDKKQKTVADLETQLMLARLDKSASGQARARELASQLEEAQNELDDFTLEHAIDVVTEDLNAQYDEYKAWLDDKLSEIDKSIKSIDGSEDEPNKEWYEQALARIEAAISGTRTWISGWNTNRENRDRAIFAKRGNLAESYSPVAHAIATEIPYSEAVSSGIISRNEMTKDEWDNAIKEYRRKHKSKYTMQSIYHSGGVVGGGQLRDNEEFAKLMKGEFVSTPAMIKNFMTKTLPSMVSAGGVNINSPLINIECGSVTRDTMPEFKNVVNQAVKEIKAQLDSGFSRTGFKKPISNY